MSEMGWFKPFDGIVRSSGGLWNTETTGDNTLHGSSQSCWLRSGWDSYVYQGSIVNADGTLSILDVKYGEYAILPA